MARTTAQKQVPRPERLTPAQRRRLRLVVTQEAAEPEQGFADLRDVASFAAGLPDAYLKCREMGHNWQYHTANRHGGSYYRVLKCERCPTERHQEISSRGAILSNRYVHAEGYLHKGMGRIVGAGKDLLRLESINRGPVIRGKIKE